MIEAVVFDMDGVLVDSEDVWNRVRMALARERGGTWRDDAQKQMMGMSSIEWSRFMVEELGARGPAEDVSAEAVVRMEAAYRESLPLLPGAVDAVRRLAALWPLAIASSANRPLIDLVLDQAGFAGAFAATVSSEEVPAGKPAPDVYLEAARRLGVAPERCAAIEDSHNGILSARAAGMRVVAVPNRLFPPRDEALALAHRVLGDMTELDAGAIES